MTIPDYKTLKPAQTREVCIKLKYPEFYKYLNDNYSEKLSFGEKMYWYFNNLTDYPVCKNCGKPTGFVNCIVGYKQYCCKKCCNSHNEKIENTKKNNLIKFGGVAPACSKEVIEKMQQTNLERHGSKGYNNRTSAKKTMIERYGGVGNSSESTKKKYQQTMLERYQVDNPMFIDSIKQKIRKTNQTLYGVDWVYQRDDVKQKIIETNLKRYGVAHYNNSEQAMQTLVKNNLMRYGVAYSFQQEDVRKKSLQTCMERYGNPLFNNPEQNKITCLERYGVDHYSKTEEWKFMMFQRKEEILNKINETKRLHGTFNTSNIEEQFEEYLTKNNIEHIRQYKSEKYPFRCDFYFPEHDLYIEVQASWTHGGHPFDDTNIKDQQKLLIWSSKNTDFYRNAIDTWSVRDVQKRTTAKNNHLNYLEVFTNNIEELIYEYKRAIKQF